jgi:hypothetical protein
MPSDIELVHDTVRLRSELLLADASSLVLSERGLFVTWDATRASQHNGAIGHPGVEDERALGRHPPDRQLRVEGDIHVDNVYLVSWEMTDPQGLADRLEELQQLREDAGLGDEPIRAPELDEFVEARNPNWTWTHREDHDVPQSENLPTLIDALRASPPKLVRTEMPLRHILDGLQDRLDSLARAVSELQANG